MAFTDEERATLRPFVEAYIYARDPGELADRCETEDRLVMGIKKINPGLSAEEIKRCIDECSPEKVSTYKLTERDAQTDKMMDALEKHVKPG